MAAYGRLHLSATPSANDCYFSIPTVRRSVFAWLKSPNPVVLPSEAAPVTNTGGGPQNRASELLVSTGYPSNLLLFGKPFGGRRPASARLPIHSLSSGLATVKVRPAESRQVRPSAMAKVFASDTPPSL